MRIVIYKGGAQYNTINHFADELGKGLVKIGHEVEFVHLLEAEKNRSLLVDALARKPQFVIAFNGMGSHLKTHEQRSIYEIVDCHYVALLLDHPAFHTGVLAKAPAQTIVGVMDPSHMEYLADADIQPKNASFFAPLAGIQSKNHKNSDRPIDILFLGTGMDSKQERAQWKLLPNAYRRTIDEAFEEFMKEPQPWVKLLREAAAKHGLHLPTHLMAPMIVQLEMVARAEYRMKVLHSFDKAAVKVTIIGNGWQAGMFKHHEVRPSADFDHALELMTQAKVALNVSPQFFGGSHDRVPIAMMNGAIVMTSASSYYEDHFVGGEHYIGYDLPTIGFSIEKLKELLADPKKLKDMQQKALKISMRDHHWEQRAVEFMDKLDTLSLAQTIYKRQWGG